VRFRDYSPSVSRFLTPDHYNDVQADLRLGPVPFDIAVADNRSFWEMVKDLGREFVNHVKEDPWQFAGEVAIGIAAAAAVGLVCATGIGCVILAGIAAGAASAAYGYGLDVAQGEHAFDLGDFATQTAIGAGIGGLTAGIGYGIGRGLSRLVQKVRLPDCHSFAPGTLVVMADGTTKPIEEVKIGDFVLATDPLTGLTVAKQVTRLHLNEDWDLAEVTVFDNATGTTSVLKTTWTHPFWSATEDKWIDAADLTSGTRLRDDEGKETQQVVAVRTWTGLERMHDLTVADIHTYYVLAGDEAVLVHNCLGEELLGRARELAKSRWGFKHTTAVAEVRSKLTGRLDRWVSTEEEGIAVAWRGGNMPAGTERLILGKGHAESKIMDALGTEWELVGIASSTRMCLGCFLRLLSLGMTPTRIGLGQVFRPSKYTPFRVMLRL
jgi:hypothetical protein